MECYQEEPRTRTTTQETLQTLQDGRTRSEHLEQLLQSAPLAPTTDPRTFLPPSLSTTALDLPLNQQAIWAELERLLLLVENVCNRDVNTLTPEQRVLWAEIDRLMDLIETICATPKDVPSHPPTYEEALGIQKKGGLSTGKPRLSNDELGQVFAAIDRVLKMAPRLDDQSVLLNPRQEKIMSGAALLALIDRLNRGKENFQNQRAVPTGRNRYAALQKLVDQITVAGQRSMSNQRVMLSADQKNRMEIGRLGGLLDRQEKSRFKNQDFMTKEQLFHNDLSKLQLDLQKSESPDLNQQRYEMSTAKQRDLFMNGLSARMDRLEDRRLANQDAMTQNQKKEQRFEELERIMDSFPQPLTGQRAAQTMRKMSVTR
ncbi:uncharacterized protein SPPG_06682 [Spizellomyces punctatus DAOM BR117]|uniref:Uncharacterized protein n=1 Tax=Spizellomyces punctatus (strain DAOM BR117) TaxID=645134 RepID=A0A0L0H9Q2_SPIPD|nr:uncharacterized protein SPPG_06682 [Spizellomyces punctatus DAOM BR117]KNC98285.1 hypothetical protein SPPG_06682 [Spizellomyces punctatus DAOM BR117]|eukprot:XP_016606325.1 hypothetical protein SPPG_06682 [Spizellomyces punctatus DAOM BR117]